VSAALLPQENRNPAVVAAPATRTMRRADRLPHDAQRLQPSEKPSQDAKMKEAFGFGLHDDPARGATPGCCAFYPLICF
jgi:hypothetical protein